MLFVTRCYEFSLFSQKNILLFTFENNKRNGDDTLTSIFILLIEDSIVTQVVECLNETQGLLFIG